METSRREPRLGPIRLLFEVGPVAGLSDGQLLDRFLDRRADREAAEVAFAALVERHGPMVLRVCRGRLGDEHDAQDAFQATFLILAGKAGSIRRHDSAASWLQGVARRVASCARRASAVRRSKERKAASRRPDFAAEADRSEIVPAVHEEVGDLPEKYRVPLMLCLLDGLTLEEVALRLGWPVGTVKTRVRRAKDQLRTRLIRRGLAPSIALVVAALSTVKTSAMPAALARSTTRAALGLGLGRSSALLSASVAGLVELGLGSLMMTRLKIAGSVVASIGLLAAGAANGLAWPAPIAQEPEKPGGTPPVAKEPTTALTVTLVKRPEDPLDDQVDLVRIDLELLAEKVANSRNEIATTGRQIEVFEGQLKQLRLARSVDNLQGLREFNPQNPNEGFEAEKKRIEARVVASIQLSGESLSQSRSKYLELRRRLKREEQQLKELEARSGAAPGPKVPGDDDRLDQLKLANIGVDVLRMDVDRWREQLRKSHRDLLEAKDRARRHGLARGATQKEFLEAEQRLAREQTFAERDLVDAEASFLGSSRQLVERERQLRDMAKDLPGPVQAEFFRSIAGPRPAADPAVDRRLSDLERKLDLILDAVKK